MSVITVILDTKKVTMGLAKCFAKCSQRIPQRRTPELYIQFAAI